MLIKFFIIIGLVAYSLYKFGNLFYRAGVSSQQQHRKPADDKMNAAPKAKKGSTFKGGEYVDFEEVK